MKDGESRDANEHEWLQVHALIPSDEPSGDRLPIKSRSTTDTTTAAATSETVATATEVQRQQQQESYAIGQCNWSPVRPEHVRGP